MIEEFNLSDKLKNTDFVNACENGVWILKQDVKEFIEILLKESTFVSKDCSKEHCDCLKNFHKAITNFAGVKLIP